MMDDLLFLTEYDLVIFDVDGTIVEGNRGEVVFDSVSRMFDWLRSRYDRRERVPAIALSASQSSVGLRYWMLMDNWGTPHNLPTMADEHVRVLKIQASIPLYTRLYVAYPYQNRTNRRWSPTPPQYAGWPEWSRNYVKPSPGLLIKAIDDYRVSPSSVLYIGDEERDEEAARAAQVSFLWAELLHDKISTALLMA